MRHKNFWMIEETRNMRPWMLWLAHVVFPGADLKRTWFTFNKTVWCPPGYFPPEDIAEHEAVHIAQQGSRFGAIAWWIMYVTSKRFRYSQELPAYVIQFRVLCERYKDRNREVDIVRAIARNLSSEQYGHMVTYDQAMEDLRKLI